MGRRSAARRQYRRPSASPPAPTGRVDRDGGRARRRGPCRVGTQGSGHLDGRRSPSPSGSAATRPAANPRRGLALSDGTPQGPPDGPTPRGQGGGTVDGECRARRRRSVAAGSCRRGADGCHCRAGLAGRRQVGLAGRRQVGLAGRIPGGLAGRRQGGLAGRIPGWAVNPGRCQVRVRAAGGTRRQDRDGPAGRRRREAVTARQRRCRDVFGRRLLCWGAPDPRRRQRAGAAGRPRCRTESAGHRRRRCRHRCGLSGGLLTGTGSGARHVSDGLRRSGGHPARGQRPGRHRRGVPFRPGRLRQVARDCGGRRRQGHPRAAGHGAARLRSHVGRRACDSCSPTAGHRPRSTVGGGVRLGCRAGAPLLPVRTERPEVRRTCRRRRKGGEEAYAETTYERRQVMKRVGAWPCGQAPPVRTGRAGLPHPAHPRLRPQAGER